MKPIHFIVWLGLLAISLPAALFGMQTSRNTTPEGMLLISGGVYKPLYDNGGDIEGVALAPFYMDENPVTVGDFLGRLTE